MKRFLELMSLEPTIEGYFISQIIRLVIDNMADFSQPLNLLFWVRARALPVRVLVIRANRDRAKAMRGGGIDGRWTEDGDSRTYTGYLKGEPYIGIALNAEEDVIEFTFL